MAESSGHIDQAELVGMIEFRDIWKELANEPELDGVVLGSVARHFAALSHERQRHSLQLPIYLAGARQFDRLREILMNVDFLSEKIATAGSQAIIEDFNLIAQAEDNEIDMQTLKELHLLQEALRLSAHVLGSCPGQLPEQLLGRLAKTPSSFLQHLLSNASIIKTTRWFRPLAAHLTQPGGRMIRSLFGSGRAISVLALLDNHRTILADDTAIRLWDLDTDTETLTIALEPGDEITDLAVGLGGTTLAGALRDGTLRIWSLEQGLELRRLRGHRGAALAVGLLADGRVVSGGTDGVLRFWDASTEMQTLAGSATAIHSLAIAPDGRHIVTGGGSLFGSAADRLVIVWDMIAGQEVRALAGHTGPVEAVAITPDGRRIISASLDQTVRVWDCATGALEHVLIGHNALVRAVAVTPDSARLLSAADEEIKIWDLDSGWQVTSLSGHGALVSDLAITTDGRRAISASWDQSVRIWDLEAAVEKAATRHSDQVERIAVSIDGRRAITASRDRTLKVWDVQRQEIIRTITGHDHWVADVAIARDSQHAVSVSWDQTIRLWDIASGKEELAWRAHDKPVRVVAITPDGRFAITGSSDRMLAVWEIASAKLLRRTAGHSGSVSAVVVDEHRVVSASDDGSIRVWDLTNGNQIHGFDGHEGRISALSIINDRTIASAGWDRTVRVWDIEAGSSLGILRGSLCGITAMVAVPKQHMLVTAGGHPSINSDNALRLWDYVSGQQLSRVIGDHPFSACAATPDGETIIAGDKEGYVHFYRLESGFE